MSKCVSVRTSNYITRFAENEYGNNIIAG